MYRAQMCMFSTICRRRSNNAKHMEINSTLQFIHIQKHQLPQHLSVLYAHLSRLNSHNLTRPGTLPKHDLSASLKHCKTNGNPSKSPFIDIQKHPNLQNMLALYSNLNRLNSHNLTRPGKLPTDDLSIAKQNEINQNDHLYTSKNANI